MWLSFSHPLKRTIFTLFFVSYFEVAFFLFSQFMPGPHTTVPPHACSSRWVPQCILNPIQHWVVLGWGFNRLDNYYWSISLHGLILLAGLAINVFCVMGPEAFSPIIYAWVIFLSTPCSTSQLGRRTDTPKNVCVFSSFFIFLILSFYSSLKATLY